jgi:DNA topoisomerase-1
MQHDASAEIPNGPEAERRSAASAHGLLALRPPGFVRADGPPREWSSTPGADAPTDADRGRLRRLAIPPAWRDVWAASSPTAPLQATGVDARGRTQYRYSAEATSTAAAVKFAEMARFATTLPALHRRVAIDLELPAADVRPVVAALVRLLERGLLRVGDERYARDNHTYGLTTLRARQVEVEGPLIRMDFVGKEHIRHQVEVEDAPVARVVAGLLASASEADAALFSSRGTGRAVTSATVNAYLHAHTGAAASAKVFRTWGATAIGASVLAGARPDDAGAGTLRNRAIRAAATALGDTPAVTRASYLHPQWERAGGSLDVARAVAAAAARAGTDAAAAVSHDERLQSAILRALAAG